MREWLRVVATDKQTYTLKFYNLCVARAWSVADLASEDDEAA